MAADPKVKTEVRASYVHGMSLPMAASASDVSYQTVRNWKRKDKAAGDDWDKARAARRMSGSGIKDMTDQILEEMAVQFMATLTALKEKKDIDPAQKAEILSRLSDSYVKTMNAAAKGNPSLDKLSVAMELIQHLSEFVALQFPQLRSQIVDVIEAFGPEIVKKYG